MYPTCAIVREFAPWWIEWYVIPRVAVPIDPEAEYRVVTNSFLASGGGGFKHVVAGLHAQRIRVRYDQLPAREQIARYQHLRGYGGAEQDHGAHH